MSKFQKLLKKLRDRQSWCPYCGGEYIHDDNCILKGNWFVFSDKDIDKSDEDE